MGFYCVDNLPVELIPIFAELHAAGEADYARAALLVDAREGSQLEKLPALLKHLRKDHPITLVYIEAGGGRLLWWFNGARAATSVRQRIASAGEFATRAAIDGADS